MIVVYKILLNPCSFIRANDETKCLANGE